MKFASIQMAKGEIFEGKRIGELVEEIINKFSEENLSCDEAKIVLEHTQNVVGEYSKVQKV